MSAFLLITDVTPSQADLCQERNSVDAALSLRFTKTHLSHWGTVTATMLKSRLQALILEMAIIKFWSTQTPVLPCISAMTLLSKPVFRMSKRLRLVCEVCMQTMITLAIALKLD
ncbi:hypothetical protein RABR111495_16115 [Rahnella bruchi]